MYAIRSYYEQKIAQDIFIANKNLIEECDIVVANLNSFRGKESDSGTVRNNFVQHTLYEVIRLANSFNKNKQENKKIRPPYFKDLDSFDKGCLECDGICATFCEENIIVIA